MTHKGMNFPFIRQQTVTTTATQILRANKRRKAVLIFNNGAVDVELLSSISQVFGNGIPIPANSNYENDHFNCQGEYFIICNSGTVDIRIEEDIQQDA